MDRNTGEPKKDSTNMKTFPLFFQIRKRNFSFKFLQQRCVSAGLQGFTQTGLGQPVSYNCQLSLWFSMDCTQGALWIIC